MAKFAIKEGSKLHPFQHLLGRVHDEKLAEMADVSVSTVSTYRRKLGIGVPRDDSPADDDADVPAVLDDADEESEPVEIEAEDEVDLHHVSPRSTAARVRLLLPAGRTKRGITWPCSIYEGPMVPLVLAAVKADGLDLAKAIQVIE